jgi:hypothetical protein
VRSIEVLHARPLLLRGAKVIGQPSMRKAPLSRCALLASAALLAACGHPATREECDELFTKNAEIELRAQKVVDPKQIADRLAAARSAEGQAFADKCVGRRITPRALDCVRRATTADQVDRCL